MTRRIAIAAAALIAASASPVLAQDVLVLRSQTVTAPGVRVPFEGPLPMAEVGLMAVEPLELGRVVADAPYTAVAITETHQALADGNRIERRTTTTIARDSRGRIRREHEAMAFGPLLPQSAVPLVTISDPSTGVHVTFDANRRVAFRGRTRTFEMRPGREPAAGTGAGVFQAAPVAAGGADLRTEELGERVVEGLLVTGTRTTMTLPAGTIGNQLPIDVVSERWFSPELQVIVETRRSDPRFGDTSYRLTNVVREEPSEALFTLPPDVRIEELPAPR